MTPPFQPSPSGVLPLPVALRELADRIEAGEPADLPDAAKAELVLASVGVSGRVEALVTRSVGAFDASTVWAGDGARSCGGWLASRTELSRARAGGITATGRVLRACPVVDAAWLAGRIGTAKARLLLDARDAWPDRFADDEAGLVSAVEPLTVQQAAVVCERWAALAEAAREADAAERAGDDPDAVPEPDPSLHNRLHISATLGGRFALDGDLDPLTGASVKGRIDAWIDRQFDLGIYRADDGMLRSQREAAALDALTEAGALPGQTKHSDPRPSVAVHIDAKTLAGEPVVDLDDLVSRFCCNDEGTPVARASVERLLCTARVAAMVVRIAEDGAVETLGVTDLLRDATRRQRRALRRRDKGCRFPGCAAPPDQCDAHHLIEWELDGPTLLVNLVLLCRFHHHLVHEGGWRFWRSTLDGELHLAKPDGTPVAVTHHGERIDPDAPVSPEPPPPRPSRPRFETRRERHARAHERQRVRPPDRLPPPSGGEPG